MSRILLTLTLFVATAVNATPVVLPTDGLVFHVEADSGVTVADGTTDVTGWADQSPQGNDLTAAGAPQLVDAGQNGEAIITFDGVDDLLERTADVMGLPAGDADRTMFSVVNYRSNGWGGVAYGAPADNETFGLIVAPPVGNLTVQGWGAGNDFKSATAGNGAGWLVQSAVHTTGGLTHYWNGAVIDNQVHAWATNPTAIVLGAEIDQTPFMDMDVAAVLIYDRVLTEEERADVEKFFSIKYLGGVAVSITSPGEGETVSSGDVPVTYSAVGTGFDHVHVALDGGAEEEPSDAAGSTHTFTGVAEGAHSVTVTLVDAAHMPVNLPDSTATVNFMTGDCAPDNFAPNCTVDTDGDGTPDSAEGETADADGDGTPDYLESSVLDADNDGAADQVDSNDADPCVPSVGGNGCVPPPPPVQPKSGGGSTSLLMLMALSGLLAARRRRYYSLAKS